MEKWSVVAVLGCAFCALIAIAVSSLVFSRGLPTEVAGRGRRPSQATIP